MGNVTRKNGWGGEVQGGSPPPGSSTDFTYGYTGNRRNGFSYDAAGNLTNDLGQTFTYDATGQQTNASYVGYSLAQVYNGNGLRVKKVEDGVTTLYLRSSVLGGQVVAEMNGSGVWTRGYVYLGSQLLAVQNAGVYWMHEDPVTKSKRVTNSSGAVVSMIETDPWGADTARSSNAAFQPRKFTSYDRDKNFHDAVFELGEVDGLRNECLRVQSDTSNAVALQGLKTLLLICDRAQQLGLSIYFVSNAS